MTQDVRRGLIQGVTSYNSPSSDLIFSVALKSIKVTEKGELQSWLWRIASSSDEKENVRERGFEQGNHSAARSHMYFTQRGYMVSLSDIIPVSNYDIILLPRKPPTVFFPSCAESHELFMSGFPAWATQTFLHGQSFIMRMLCKMLNSSTAVIILPLCCVITPLKQRCHGIYDSWYHVAASVTGQSGTVR